MRAQTLYAAQKAMSVSPLMISSLKSMSKISSVVRRIAVRFALGKTSAVVVENQTIRIRTGVSRMKPTRATMRKMKNLP